jgi:hypothetical protein
MHNINEEMFNNSGCVSSGQGCQMVYFQTKDRNLGKFWRVLQWKMLVHFIDFGLFYGHLIYCTYIRYILWQCVWYIFPHFGILYQEKSGNPGSRLNPFTTATINTHDYFDGFASKLPLMQRKLKFEIKSLITYTVWNCGPGVTVMTTMFADFCLSTFGAKNGNFLDKHCLDIK